MDPNGAARGQADRDPGRHAGRGARSTARSCSTSVVETDEALMERYLEGQELVDRRGRARAEGRGDARRGLPRRLRRRDEEPRHDRAARPARRGRPVAGEEGRADRASTAAERPRSSSRRSPTRSPAASTSSACSSGTLNGDSTIVNARTHAQGAVGQLLEMQGKEHDQVDGVRRGRHRRGREAEGDADRRPAARRRARGRAARASASPSR